MSSTHAADFAEAKHLLEDFGKFIGIEGIAFNDEGVCWLEIEEKLISIAMQPKSRSLLLEVVVGVLAPDASRDQLVTILSANALAFREGRGSLLYDPEEQVVVWGDRIDPRRLTVQEFMETLMRGMEQAAIWTQQFETLIAAAPAEQTESRYEQATAIDPSFMVRC